MFEPAPPTAVKIRGLFRHHPDGPWTPTTVYQLGGRDDGPLHLRILETASGATLPDPDAPEPLRLSGTVVTVRGWETIGGDGEWDLYQANGPGQVLIPPWRLRGASRRLTRS